MTKNHSICLQTGKQNYSRMGALYALMTAMEMGNEYRPVRYYYCDDCHHYHLTSQKAYQADFHARTTSYMH